MKSEYIYDNDVDEAIEPEDVDLTSFDIKDELNPGLWKTEDKMNPKARRALLVLAKDFIEDLAIDWITPKDIIVTGSAANYNWNEEYSDIDLHVIVDTSKISKQKDFVERYCKDAKREWNGKHDIRIANFPVEVYVQDVKETVKAGGTYSILKDKWIEKPSKEKLNNGKFDRDSVRKKASEFMNQIDELLARFDAGEDTKKIYTEASKLFDKIKESRKTGAKKNFEMSTNNLAFKVLRRTGYIESLSGLKAKCYDIIHSY